MAPVLKKAEVKEVLDKFYEIFDPEDRKCVKLIHKLREYVQKRTHTNSHPQNEEEGTESEETENVNEDNDVSFNSESEKSDCESDMDYLENADMNSPDPSEEEEETKSDSNLWIDSKMVGEAEPEPWTEVTFGGKIEDKDWLERVDHPLLNDLILKLVIGHVRRYDLKACRGVCKKWNEHTLPLMHSAFQVTIHGTKSVEENAETRRIVDFVKLFKSNELGIPFAKYRLGPFRTTDGAGKQFLEICGDSIKEIELVQPSGSHHYVRTIENISELLKFSPKLESLKISGQFVSRSRNVVKLFPDSTPKLSALKNLTVDHDSRKSPIQYCPTFFDELLSVSANISDIDIQHHDYETTQINGITLVLNTIEKLGIESSIQSLSLEFLTLDLIEVLRRMTEKPNGLKLKKIRFLLDVSIDNSTTYTQLASIFKDTLEDFYVIGQTRKIDLMDLQKMPKLKSFKTYLIYCSGNTPVNLNHIFPVIETLYILREYVHFKIPEPVELFSQFEVCPTITTFVLHEDIERIYTFQDISRVFPNLRKVKLRVEGEESGQVVRQIWAIMTQLESLSLTACIESKVRDVVKLDSLFTGIPIEGLNKIRRIIPDLEKLTAQDRRKKILNLVERQRTQQPSIRNLTNLRHLELRVTSTCRGRPIDLLSNVTGYLALYLMKHLNHLDIRRCEFTKTCCEILTMETGVEGWFFQTDPYKDIITPYPFPYRVSHFDD